MITKALINKILIIMTKALKLQATDKQFLISIDKSAIDKEFLLRLMNRIRMEYLAKSVDFDENIEHLGEEIKADWWNKNKDRLLNSEE